MARTDPRPHYGTKRRVDANGYVTIYEPGHPLARADGYVYEHRRVAWEAGLLRDPELHVHHCNGDKQDNAVENLEILTEQEHARRHLAERGYVRNQFGVWILKAKQAPKTERECAGCGSAISVDLRRDARYCSARCRVATWKRGTAGMCGLR